MNSKCNCKECACPDSKNFNPYLGSEDVDLACETINCDASLITHEPYMHLWFKSPDGWLCPKCTKEYWEQIVQCAVCKCWLHRDLAAKTIHGWHITRYCCSDCFNKEPEKDE